MLKITERHAGENIILDLEGNIVMGGGTAHLHEAITQLIEQNKNKILLNFKDVTYIDSSGLGEFVICSQALGKAGGYLKLSNLSAKTKEVLAISSVLSLLDIYDDEVSALARYTNRR